jgi:dipeptidyl aminopeptidase/acylaminoacyl peptidase
MKQFLLFLCFLPVLTTRAQEQTTYQEPPAVMKDLLLAPGTPSVSLSRKGDWMLLMERSSYPTIAELAEPELRIAGLRMNPANFSASRSGSITKLTLRNLATKTDYTVRGLPADLHAAAVQWSPNDSLIAFTHTSETRVDLYVLRVADQQAKQVNNAPLNTLPNIAFSWAGNQKLVYKVVPPGRSGLPQRQPAPTGPVIQENLGKAGASRTYQDLIKNPYDEEAFSYMMMAQLVVNNLQMETAIGSPDLYGSYSVSPDANYVMTTTIQKPFSYLVPVNGFPQKISVMDMRGQVVKLLASNPSTEGAPIGFDDVPERPRGFQWRPDHPSTIIYVKAVDKGLGRSRSEYRDAVFATTPASTEPDKLLFRTKMRYSGIAWGNETTAIVYESMFATRRTRMSRFNPATGQLDSLYERSSNDAYADIGSPVSRKNEYGRNVLALLKGKELLLESEGSSPDGDLPLLQTMDLATGKRNLLWRCAAPYYETVVDVLDPERGIFLTSRESLTETPNYYLRDLRKKSAIGTPLTNFSNPYAALEGITKTKISYKRADNVDLTGDLYLPKGYDPKAQGPLPVVIWAYPREYKSAADAAQVRGSKYRFTRLNWGSPIYWVTQGYAILDNAEMPIVGEGDQEPNDQFIPQLYLNAHAAIQELAKRGVGDSNRVAVGGHSYGAFMTANLLAHTKLFKAGIARSGAYNRTLTPFGFQAEERTYWQAPQVYYNMSPFSFADKIKTPLLMTHGEMDNNSGTFPIQSERLYNAIKGHGGTVRFVLLPYESHGYAAKENLLHLLWEQHQWLEKYVKNAKP